MFAAPNWVTMPSNHSEPAMSSTRRRPDRAPRDLAAWRVAAVGAGSAAILLGALLDTVSATPLPPREILPAPPIEGVTLLRAGLILAGVVMLLMAVARTGYRRISPADRLASPPLESAGDIGAATSLLLLAAITAVALALRIANLGSDLWLDEITPLLDYGQASVGQVLVSYISSNSHLLNTLLVKVFVATFGEHEWIVRLPAALFGVGAVPVAYAVSRLALTRIESLCVSLLLAVSYHHVFFSQNARGYAAYLFFTLLSTVLLVRALREDQPRDWALFAVATVLNFTSVLISAFVFAAHAAVVAAAAAAAARRGGSARPLLRRGAAVFAVTAFLGFIVYAMIIPQAYVYARGVYSDPSAGFSPLSLEFVRELARGLSPGLGAAAAVAAMPLAGALVAGIWRLARRNWAMLAALGLPLAFQAGLLVVSGLVISPRLFLLALPLGIAALVAGIFAAARAAGARAARPRLATPLVAIGVGLVSLGSLVQLREYYSVPKQAYRSSVAFAEEQRGPDGLVVVVHLAEAGFRYYTAHLGIDTSDTYYFVRSVDDFDRILAANPGRRVVLVTTFSRALRLAHADLNDRIARDFTVVHTFPGSVGDGSISVWEARTVAARLAPGG